MSGEGESSDGVQSNVKTGQTPSLGRLLSKLNEFEVQVYRELCQGVDHTLDQDELEERLHLGTVDRTKLAEALNRLARRHLVEFRTDAGGQVSLFHAVDQSEALVRKELSPDEGLVYDIIKDAGNQGIWTRTLQKRSNAHSSNIAKALKSLQAKKLVKSVHSVKAKTKKLYMLYGLQPGAEITGGPWYTDHEFDVGFIDGVRRLALDAISKKGGTGNAKASNCPSLEAIWRVITSARVVQEDLEKEHVEQILDTLIYDGKVHRISLGSGHQDVYQLTKEVTLTASINALPCTTCPVFDECQQDGIINPEECPYMDTWLAAE